MGGLTWGRAAALALRSMSARLGRTALTIGAVGLASALLVSLAIIVDTGNTRVVRQLSKGGPVTAIKVTAGQGSLSPADVERLAHLDGVDLSSPVFGIPVVVAYGDAHSFTDAEVGIDVARSQALPISLLAGRLPGADSRLEVAVTQGWLDRIGLNSKKPDEAVGGQVLIGIVRTGGGDPPPSRWLRVTIVGVVAQEAAPGGIVAPLAAAEVAWRWAQVGGDPWAPGEAPLAYSAAVVVASGLDRVHPVRQAIDDLGYHASAPEQLVATVQRYLHVVDLVLGGIGVVALGISAFAIAITLAAAVRERRREIGVLKAVGARDRDVMRWFIVEALLFGVLGGMIGTAAGAVVARALGEVVNRYLRSQALEGVHVGLPMAIAGVGVGSAVVVSLIAGAIPAWRAARLPARAAMGSL